MQYLYRTQYSFSQYVDVSKSGGNFSYTGCDWLDSMSVQTEAEAAGKLDNADVYLVYLADTTQW